MSEGKPLVPKLRFPGFKDAADWKFTQLAKLATRAKNKNRDEKIERVLTNSAEFGVMDQRDYFDKDIATQGKLENYFVVELGDYVYNPRISSAAPVGPISKNKIGAGVMSPLYTIFKFKDNKNDFYDHYFKTTGWHAYMRKASSTGARHDRMAISSDGFMALPLPISSLEEQQKIADCLSSLDELIVTLDSQEPATGKKERLESVMDFACGSGSLLLNVRKRMGPHGIGKIYGQEKNITTYNLARMNMLLHGVKDTEFEIFHGDTLTNDWDMLREPNPAKKPAFDAIVANPPFSYRWEPTDALADDVRFKNHGLAPKSAADFAFLLHGFHFLKEEGVMAIILPHGVLFRGGAEERIRTKLLKNGHIDTVIGLPSNLFYSTGIPVCILVLKKCKKPDDVLFINAAEHFVKGKRQNQMTDEHIAKIIKTYQFREEEPRYSRRIEMAEIEKNDFNLNISRYISTAVGEPEIDLAATHAELVQIEKDIAAAKQKHNAFLKELGLSPLP